MANPDHAHREVRRRVMRPKDDLPRRCALLLDALASGIGICRAREMAWLPQETLRLHRQRYPLFDAQVRSATARGAVRLAYEAWWHAVDLARVEPRRPALAPEPPPDNTIRGLIATLQAAGEDGEAVRPVPAGPQAAKHRRAWKCPITDPVLLQLIHDATSIGVSTTTDAAGL